MSIDVACSKGCGGIIHVSDEQLAELQSLNKAVVVSHSVCPRDVVEDERPIYKVSLEVTKRFPGQPESEARTLAKNGAEVIGATFVDAFEKLSNALGAQWSETRKWAEVAENDL